MTGPTQWTRAVNDVCVTLCGPSGRVTIRKETTRWERCCVGFGVLATQLSAGSTLTLPLVPEAVPSVREHADALLEIALRVRAAAVDAATGSWTYTLALPPRGAWDPLVFRAIVQAALASSSLPSPAVSSVPSPADGPSDPVDPSAPGPAPMIPSSTSPPASSFAAQTVSASPATVTALPSTEPPPPLLSMPQQTASPMPATSSSSASAVSAAVQSAYGLDYQVPLATEQAAEPTPLSPPPAATQLEHLPVPTPIPDAADVPEVLKSLLQIALLLNSAEAKCEDVSVTDTGAVLITMALNQPTAPSTAVSYTVQFPGVFDEAALMEAVSAAVDVSTGEDSPMLLAWKPRIEQYNLASELWFRFPADYIDTSSLNETTHLPYPVHGNPHLIAFHPLLRWHPDFWNTSALSLCGHRSQALRMILRHGGPACLDLASWVVLANALAVRATRFVARSVCRSILAMISARRTNFRHQEMLQLGGLPVLMAQLPKYSMSSLVQVLHARVNRLIGEDHPDGRAAAVAELSRLRDESLVNYQAILARSQELLRQGLSRRSMLAAPGTSQPPALQPHEDFVRVMNDVPKMAMLWFAAERFALMRQLNTAAAEVYDVGCSIWYPGEARVNWDSMSGGFGPELPSVLTEQHVLITFAALHYARAILDAPDATPQHLVDARIKAWFAYRARSNAMPVGSPSISKAFCAWNDLDLRLSTTPAPADL